MKTKLMILAIVVLTAAGCATAPAVVSSSTSTPLPAQEQVPVEAQPQVAASTPTQAVVEVVPVTPEPTATSVPAVKNENDRCDNPYFPVVAGATWTYANTSIPQFTHTLNVSDDQLFIIQVVDAENTFNIEGQCVEGGVILMNTGLSTTASSEGGMGVVTTTNQDGVTLPDDIQVGDDWTQTIAYSAGSEGQLQFSGTIETSYKAVGYESVTVPAGTFEALKIEQTTTLTMAGSSFDTSSNLWYVQGIGNVKAEQTGMDGNPSVTELVSYTIP